MSSFQQFSVILLVHRQVFTGRGEGIGICTIFVISQGSGNPNLRYTRSNNGGTSMGDKRGNFPVDTKKSRKSEAFAIMMMIIIINE